MRSYSNSMRSNSVRSQVRGNNKFAEAVNHWYYNVWQKENTPWYYRHIRSSPVVEFKTNANVIKMLKRFFHNNNNSHYYNSNYLASYALKQIPKHRKFYIMNLEPFRFPYGSRGLYGMHGMVRITNQKKTTEHGRLGLVNKALMNRYLQKRALEQLAQEKYTLKNAAKLFKVATILEKGIQRKYESARKAGQKWRSQARLQAGRREAEAMMPRERFEAYKRPGSLFLTAVQKFKNLRGRSAPKQKTPPSPKSPTVKNNRRELEAKVSKTLPKPLFPKNRIYVRV